MNVRFKTADEDITVTFPVGVEVCRIITKQGTEVLVEPSTNQQSAQQPTPLPVPLMDELVGRGSSPASIQVYNERDQTGDYTRVRVSGVREPIIARNREKITVVIEDLGGQTRVRTFRGTLAHAD